jgi:hypothetical protein
MEAAIELFFQHVVQHLPLYMVCVVMAVAVWTPN